MRTKVILIAGLIFSVQLVAVGRLAAQSISPAGGKSDEVYPALTLRGHTSGYSLFQESNLQNVQHSTIADYSPFLFGATSIGAYTQGEIPFKKRLYFKLSVIGVDNSLLSGEIPAGTTGMRTLLVPAQIGTHIPVFRERLGDFEYILSGDASAGLLFGWAYPTDGNFFGYSIPNSRFASGASAYLGIGNTVKVSRFAGLYLNGGVSYFDIFSHFVLPQSQYLIPNVSVGFYFGPGSL
ncbi:MAG: hypothetical protein ACP5MI_09795 [Candidatus Kryptoniota bacterium]